MSTFKTTDYVKGIVFGLLKTPMGSIPGYLGEKPTKKPESSEVTEYYVINCLPVPADFMQKIYFNVNYHVKDIDEGIPDDTKLASGTAAVMAVLKKVTATSYLIDFEGQGDEKEPALGEHYSNMKFSFKQINK